MEPLALHAAVFLVALFYSSVGHGGASGYLAVLALFSLPMDLAVTSALCLNILVASTALAAFHRAGHFRWSLAWPFLLGSVPAAWLGGFWSLPPHATSFVLAAALSLAGLRMWLSAPPRAHTYPPSVGAALPIGAAIGLISGMVGIGGGVFLSPVLLLMGWAGVKETAAASACFILANSAAGLAGHLHHVPAVLPALGMPLILSALIGGWAGSTLGAGRMSPPAVRRALSLVLWTAGLKLAFQ